MPEVEQNQTVDAEDEGEVEMSFLDHLEELRWRLIYALIGIVIGTIIAWLVK